LSELKSKTILSVRWFYQDGWNFEREQTMMFVVSQDGGLEALARTKRERERMKYEAEKVGRWNGIQQSVRHSASRIASFRRYKSRQFAQEHIRETSSASSSSCRVLSPHFSTGLTMRRSSSFSYDPAIPSSSTYPLR